jgi:hypothetical protein
MSVYDKMLYRGPLESSTFISCTLLDSAINSSNSPFLLRGLVK